MSKILEPLPYFKWFWRDWRANRRVQRLHYVARGLYRDLLDEQWENGSLSPKIEDLADICGCPEEVMKEHWETLASFFETLDDGSLANAKLEKQRTEEDATRAARAKSGRAGGKAKLQNIKEKVANAKQVPEVAEICHIAEQSRAIAEQSISEQETENFDGQEENMKLKDELTKIAAQYGEKAGGYKTSWDEVKTLGVAHGTGAVSRDFEEWIRENAGDDFPKGAVVAYLRVAEDRLRAETPAVAEATAGVSLTRELSYLSGGLVAFLDKQRIRLAEVLKEFSAEEIQSAFKIWLEDHDLNDPFTLKGAANNFTQTADQLCYSAQRRKLESEAAKIQRDETAKRLQEEAESERRKKEAEKLKESELFDPLS